MGDHSAMLEKFRTMRAARETDPPTWNRLRGELVEENMGLVFRMMHRCHFRRDDDEGVSDGTYALLRTVDGFDPDRGAQFSTYACRAILKALARRTKDRLCGRRRPTLVDQFDDLKPVDWRHGPADAPMLSREVWDRARMLLDEREWLVVSARIKGEGLRDIGDGIGLVKERVRQIERRAIGKLRQAFGVREAWIGNRPCKARQAALAGRA